MNSSDLKQAFIDTAKALQAIEQVYPKNINVDEAVRVLNSLDDTSVAVVAALIKMPAADLKAMIPGIIQALQSVNQIFVTGEAITLADLLNGLSNRPIILAIIARLF